MMLMSTPNKHSIQHPSPTCDSGMPPYYQRHCTPSHFTAENSPFDPRALSPSPLRQRPLFPATTSPKHDPDDFFTSPFKSIPKSSVLSKPQPISADDEEGSIFLSTPASPFGQPSGSHSSLPPAKQARRSSLGRFALKPLNTGFPPTGVALTPATPEPGVGVGVGAGVKRKSAAQTTPLHQHHQLATPLKLESWTTTTSEGKLNIPFDRLAPLPTPKTTARTPQTKAETEAHLRRQTASLTRLRISDRDDSGDEYNGNANDSGCEIDDDDDDEGNTLFLSSVRMKSKVIAGRTTAGRMPAVKGKDKEEVAEVISPGGHVTKRRARSRPVSAELKQSFRTPKSPVRGVAASANTARAKAGGSVAFPSYRTRTSSSSSTSEAGSPRPRRRINAAATRVQPPPLLPPPKSAVKSTDQPLPPRPPLSRLESVSSATLFFGPAIPSPTKQPSHSRTDTLLSPGCRKQRATNRHSYAGPGSEGSDLQAWNTIQARLPSPASSPLGDVVNTDVEEMDFEDTPPNSSFVFSVTANTPSPERKIVLRKKYKPHDSGVVFSDDDGSLFLSHGNNGGNRSPAGGDFLVPLVRSANSGDSISVFSDGDDGLVTPGMGPGSDSGWPDEGVFVRGADDNRRALLEGGVESGDVDVDAFIMRTLASAAKGPHEVTKRVPGTPVKKVRTTFLGSERPWQSAVATKVGPRLEFDDKKVNAPRKSLPAVFPGLQRKMVDDKLGDSTDSEGEEDSPSTRKDSKYAGLGLGRPTFDAVPFALSRTRWLMRRSSSGAFSSGSDSASVANTPTRGKPVDWQLSKPHLPAIFSQSQQQHGALGLSPVRSASGSSNSSTVTISPTDRSRYLAASGVRPPAPRARSATRRSSDLTAAVGECGRFEREFLELAEVGSGEFGKVIKVRRKDGNDDEVFAIKKSKRFEGTKHRLRLREEVDILKHLSQAAFASGFRGRHPNVLAYIDSWEEDEILFIQTELCDLGNFARFLWEYGRVFPRLDEARVWKIIADLSNGLRFIHDAGIIHLDIKPSNVFLTKEGKFKIGDFGMASLWPRPPPASDMSGPLSSSGVRGGFEREGDKLYLAPEVLQGRYGKEADVFSLGMTILETASNIVVPDQGEAWHRLRREDFSQVDFQDLSEALIGLITQMMRTEPASRISAHGICVHPVVSHAKEAMERLLAKARREGKSEFTASPLASVAEGFLDEILGRASDERDWGMDTSP